VEWQERALAALIKECESSDAFVERCRQAYGRNVAIRGKIKSEPVAADALEGVWRSAEIESVRQTFA
ncbi:MAG TPA: hypothetical protein VHO25_03250, partial [Polyangiaceae bacterium]|nr:hypothetical protein [Polyangiaceae bacterium]